MILAIILFVIGLVIIIKCGDWFVEAAVWLAEITKIPKMLIGATIVSLATTLPELFVSVIAVSNGSSNLGIGNALGSVICNTGLILAVSIIFRPSRIDSKLFYTKAAIMVLSLALIFVFSLDGILTRLESVFLIMLLAVFIYVNIRNAKRSRIKALSDYEALKELEHINTDKKQVLLNTMKFLAGAAGIVLGAQLLVNNGIKIADALGVSEGIIGVTIVAVGTSLPEFVTTITAIRKKETSLGIGNILGANILNITLILSACGIISVDGLRISDDNIMIGASTVSRSIFIDMPVAALLFAILIAVPVLTKGKLKRLQGIFMLAVYIAFIVFLAVSAK